MRTLDQLAAEIHDINIANGWNTIQPPDWLATYKIPAILALIHSEVSEALEAFRDGDVAGFQEELADVLIRTLDLAGGIMPHSIERIVVAKMEKNKGRGAGLGHGGKRV